MAETPRRVPRQSGVQELQNALAYTDIYPTISQSSFSRRWLGPKGFGPRHINDNMPFSLWDERSQTFRPASRAEMSYIGEIYDAKRITFYEWILMIETLNPPKPVDICLRVLSLQLRAPVDASQTHVPTSIGVKGRVRRKSRCDAVITAVSGLAHVRQVNLLPAATVVELEYGDGKGYLRKSLPDVVANRATTHHHGIESFLTSVRNHARERTLDPAGYFPGALAQDDTEYINEPNWGILSPGMRVSTRACAETVRSTTSGIILRKRGDCYITVANHGFPNTKEVFHPTPSGEKIGDIVNRYPELDIAMVRLTPANSDRYTDRVYFQAEPPRSLAEVRDMIPGLRKGFLVTPLFLSTNGSRKSLFNVFGATNSELNKGICGAPLVEDTGRVAGFFHLAAGDWAESAVLDDLVAEGWQVLKLLCWSGCFLS